MRRVVVRLRRPPPAPTSRQLADRLLIWHADMIGHIESNARTADDLERTAKAQAESARRCAEEALARFDGEPETYAALMGCSARYALTARVLSQRAKELRG